MGIVVRLEYFEQPVVVDFEYAGYKYYKQFDFKGAFRVKNNVPEFLTPDALYDVVIEMLCANLITSYTEFKALNLGYNTTSKLITEGPPNVRKFARKYYASLPPF